MPSLSQLISCMPAKAMKKNIIVSAKDEMMALMKGAFHQVDLLHRLKMAISISCDAIKAVQEAIAIRQGARINETIIAAAKPA